MTVGSVAKFLITFIGTVLYTAIAYLTDDHLSNQEILTSILAGLMAVGVYVVPNSPYPPNPPR